MKIRKRMGRPKFRMARSRTARGVIDSPISGQVIESLDDGARGNATSERQRGTSEGGVLEIASSSHAASHEPTPVRLAERMASLSDNFAHAMKRQAVASAADVPTRK